MAGLSLVGRFPTSTLSLLKTRVAAETNGAVAVIERTNAWLIARVKYQQKQVKVNKTTTTTKKKRILKSF